ncbi:Sucrase/ferredoxin-like-domain-containing protein [Schizophyllum commune]
MQFELNLDRLEQPSSRLGTAYTVAGGRLNLTNIALENIDEVEAQILEHISTAPDRSVRQEQGLDFYVCTHGERDCRCLEHGKPVVEALQTEIARRRLKETLPPINVYECGHVGQHAFAANVLLYPHGEWFGLLRPEHVPEFLQAALSVPSRPRTAKDPPLFPGHWRGRMGLSRDEQLTLYQSHKA